MILEVHGYSTNFNGYDWMIWKPILVLAKYFQQYSPETNIVDVILNLAADKTAEKKKLAALGQDTTLLEALRDIYLRKIELLDKRLDGTEFYATKHIREVLAYRLDLTSDSEAYARLTLGKVGKMINRLDIGQSDQARVRGENKPVRGVWIESNRLNDIFTRFGMEPVKEEMRLAHNTSIEELTGQINE